MSAFIVLCVTVCLSVFAITSAMAIVGVNALLGIAAWVKKWRGPRRSVSFFAIRILPFVLAAMATFALVLPAFIIFEPRRSAEAPEAHLWILAGLGLALLAVIVVRGIRLFYSTRTVTHRWRTLGTRIESRVVVPVYKNEDLGSLVAVAGLVRPTIFLGRNATDLTQNELHAVLEHELAHVRSRDNLKRFALAVTTLPRWMGPLARLDKEWSRTAELDADSRAVRNGVSPLDLACALVKLGRAELTPLGGSLAVSHLVPYGRTSMIEDRVQRLISETEVQSTLVGVDTWRVGAVFVTLFYLLLLPNILPIVHEAIEILVR